MGAGEGIQSGFVTTADGTHMHYLEAGQGPDVLLVPGWSLTAALWRHQIVELSRTHHVIALDHRGQGLSDKPGHGYRVARLAADAHEVIEALGLTEVTWIGHSMGCAVGWSYWELFGGGRLNGMVLIDQAAVTVALPHWPEGLADKLGVTYHVADWTAHISSLRGPDAEATRSATLATMWTGEMAVQDREWVTEQSLLMDSEASGAVGFDHGMQDWRTVLPQITVPVLVIGGEASMVPLAAIEYVAKSIPASTLRVLSTAERGSHLSFLENPDVVNREIRTFVDRLSAVPVRF